jgi:hypothetical protein
MGESMKLALPPLESFTLLCPAYDREHTYGSPAFHAQQCGLTPEALMAAVRAPRGAA